tara:strand:- start:841 stop:1053 length:213 start_codon:yes stop_codon:yes gene_type:complete
MSKDDKWIQKANIKKGALRNIAKKMGLIDNNEKLSNKDLSILDKKAKKDKNKLLAKRVNLARTFKKMRKG